MAAGRVSYVETKPFHSSQNLVKRSKDGDAVFELNIIINKELISLFLWFGKDLVVQEPKELRKILKDELKTALNNYKV